MNAVDAAIIALKPVRKDTPADYAPAALSLGFQSNGHTKCARCILFVMVICHSSLPSVERVMLSVRRRYSGRSNALPSRSTYASAISRVSSGTASVGFLS